MSSRNLLAALFSEKSTPKYDGRQENSSNSLFGKTIISPSFFCDKYRSVSALKKIEAG